MKFKAIIFDLDGTLVDTLPGIAAAMNRVLANAGLPVHETDRYRSFIGDGLECMVKRALPPEIISSTMIRQAIADTAMEYERSWAEGSRLYPGTSGLLQACAGSGMRLAILSNKPDKPTRDMVDYFFPSNIFSHVAGAVGAIPPKPDPTGAELTAGKLGVPCDACLFLGDMGVDMATARAAGMFPVGALWGYRSAEELMTAGAGMLVRSPADFTAFFQ
ncbi:MAG: HAD family hydrolase [Pseudomonadota bacterium]